MTNPIDEPAFPCKTMMLVDESYLPMGSTTNTYEIKKVSKYVDSSGMTLRDYLAAKAMQAFISNFSSLNVGENICTRAYEIADAMLLERQKNEQS